ncbi:hypothetical protein ANCDUO_21013 [Ancylostoma duodenale]|uniref:Uncharacterized protein n=1 Tax=Ancylostoma duodenale TaxID=51022 RepID=A0A0C2FQH3_9BILA|nr:hypothetical protein ANCDUO_21013 [Ancylostoma duodenale]
MHCDRRPRSGSEGRYGDDVRGQVERESHCTTTGWRSVAVPGELHGMWTEFEKFGSKKLSWKSLVQPTIDLLEEGFGCYEADWVATTYRSYLALQWIEADQSIQDYCLSTI